MAPQWYCNLAGSEIGPLAPSQVRRLAAEGRLRKDDFVRKGTEGPWVRAEQVKGLFEASGEEAPSERPPSEPPTLPAVPPAPPAIPVPPQGPARPIPVRSNQRGEEPSSSTPSVGLAQWRLARERAKRRRRFYILLVGFLVIVAAGLIILLRPPSGTTDPATQPPSKAEPKERPGSASDLDIDLSDEGEEKPSSKSDGSSDEAGPDSSEGSDPGEPKDADGSQAIDASAEEPAVLDGVRVAIKSVGLGPPRVQDARGRFKRPLTSYLVINLAILNTDASEQLEYNGWGNFHSVLLADDLGHEYEQWRYNGVSIVGQVEQAELSSDEPLTDVLVFHRPDPKAKRLRLTLPGIAFGKQGSVKFTIPLTMIEELTTDSDSAADTDASTPKSPRKKPDAKPPADKKPFDPNKDPNGDVSKIMEDIEALGGGDAEGETPTEFGEDEDRKATDDPDK